jgi:hypothetical protein
MEMSKRTASEVGDHLLADRVVVVRALGLDQFERESVNSAW